APKSCTYTTIGKRPVRGDAFAISFCGLAAPRAGYSTIVSSVRLGFAAALPLAGVGRVASTKLITRLPTANGPFRLAIVVLDAPVATTRVVSACRSDKRWRHILRRFSKVFGALGASALLAAAAASPASAADKNARHEVGFFDGGSATVLTHGLNNPRELSLT